MGTNISEQWRREGSCRQHGAKCAVDKRFSDEHNTKMCCAAFQNGFDLVTEGNIMRYPEVTSLVIIGDSLIIKWRGQGEANRLSKLLPFSGFKVRDISIMLLLNAGTLLLKGKAVPLQAWSSPEGSRKLRFPDFTTMAQDGGKVFSRTHRPPLPPGNTPGTHFC